jgi:hypothetical protein
LQNYLVEMQGEATNSCRKYGVLCQKKIKKKE